VVAISRTVIIKSWPFWGGVTALARVTWVGYYLTGFTSQASVLVVLASTSPLFSPRSLTLLFSFVFYETRNRDLCALFHYSKLRRYNNSNKKIFFFVVLQLLIY
jgi:hypothetical protein